MKIQQKRGKIDFNSKTYTFTLELGEQIKAGELSIRFQEVIFEDYPPEEIDENNPGIVIYLKLQYLDNKETLIFSDYDEKQKKWLKFIITLIEVDDVKARIKINVKED
jgi:hypothetical protein